jgi:hypothetical protein
MGNSLPFAYDKDNCCQQLQADPELSNQGGKANGYAHIQPGNIEIVNKLAKVGTVKQLRAMHLKKKMLHTYSDSIIPVLNTSAATTVPMGRGIRE